MNLSYEQNAWAAEYLLGQRREQCWETYNESGFDQCNECGVNDVEMPCPFYPFPPVTLEQVIEAMATRGFLFLRYDSGLPERHWRVMTWKGDKEPWQCVDTDTPLATLVWMAQQAEIEPSEEA